MLVLMAIPARDTHLVQQATTPWCRLRTFISFACPKETNQRKGHHQIKRALLSPIAQFLLNFIQENASIKAPTAHRHAFGGHPRADLLKTNASLLATILLNTPGSTFDIRGAASPEEILRGAQNDMIETDQHSTINIPLPQSTFLLSTSMTKRR